MFSILEYSMVSHICRINLNEYSNVGGGPCDVVAHVLECDKVARVFEL